MSAPRPPRAGTVRTRAFELKVVGMKDLRKLLRDLDAGLPGELRDTNKRVVEEVLVPPVRAAAAAHRPHGASTGTRAHPMHWADAVATVRAVASQTSSAILYGSTAKRAAWMVGYEFGSIKYKQFPPSSPRLGGGSAGYFFYPTIRAAVPQIVDAYADALDKFMGRTVNANRTEAA
jgi:hypothetical protein